jgi:hypothetical protein
MKRSVLIRQDAKNKKSHGFFGIRLILAVEPGGNPDLEPGALLPFSTFPYANTRYIKDLFGNEQCPVLRIIRIEEFPFLFLRHCWAIVFVKKDRSALFHPGCQPDNRHNIPILQSLFYEAEQCLLELQVCKYLDGFRQEFTVSLTKADMGNDIKENFVHVLP